MKKDDGIARLPNGVLIPEEVRDRLVKEYSSPKTPTVKFDPSQATTKDLQDHDFSGYRVNQFTQDLELWCVGKMMVRRKLIECTPEVMATMHEEAFSTSGTVVQVPLGGKRG